MRTELIWGDFQQMGRFNGTLAELKKLVQQSGSPGTWTETARWKRYRLKKGDEALVWWPHTGDMLTVRFVTRNLYRQSDLDWVSARNGQKRRSRRWTPFLIEGEEFTLPELVFRDLDYFYHIYEEGLDAADDEIDEFELAEILDKMRSIVVPKRGGKHPRVMHKFGPNHTYCGFEITERPVESVPQRGTLIVADHIDLTTHLDWEPRRTQTSPIGALISWLDADGKTTWDRARCERFFDNEGNFYRRTKAAG